MNLSAGGPLQSIPRGHLSAPPGWALVLALLLALAGCGDTEATSSGFEKATTTNHDFTLHPISAGDVPIGLAVADFNGTNAFAVANQLGDSVTIYTQTAPGSTSFTRQDVAVGNSPTQILFADLHGDPDHPDIAVITESNQANSVVVVRNDGSDSFSLGAKYSAGQAILQISAACMQAQCEGGTPATTAVDLVVSVPKSNDVRVLLNDGAGNLTPTVRNLSGNPGRFAVADFSGDGHQDLAVVLPADDDVEILLGDGTGAFPSAVVHGTKRYPIHIAAGTFRNPAGNIDLAISARDEDRVNFFLGNGAGDFASGGYKTVSDSPGELLIANFSGNPDVVVTNRGKKSIYIFIGDGAGGFTSSSFSSSEDPFDLSAGNFTTSGNLDLVVAELRDRVLGVYQGNGAGEFSRSQVAFESQVTQPIRVNFCGGAYDDVLLLQSQVDRVVLLCNAN